MKSIEEELAALETKQQEKREEIAARYAILGLLGEGVEGYAPPSIHYWKLYNSRGSVSFNIQKYSSIAEGKSPDRKLLAYLLEKFPPVARVQVKDGCTSFRPLGDWKGELLDVYPVTVRLEVFQGPDVKFEWYAELNGQLWEFKVEFSLYQTDLGELRVAYDYYDRWESKIKRVTTCEFIPKHGAQRIRWASGSPETPNSFTIWWDVDSGKQVDFPALVKD